MRRRLLPVLAILGLVLGLAGPASAATTGASATSWYWESQESVSHSDTTGGCPQTEPPPPVCPEQRQSIPNPHSAGSLPVQVFRGDDEKVSAVNFDLSFIPPQGAVISRFTFSIVESQEGRDRSQTINASGKTIQACLITDGWPASEDGAEDKENAPQFECGSAADGKRTGSNPARWQFDITSLAQAWGADPFSANGVMLVGKQKNENWQIVLRGPFREGGSVKGKDNIKADVAFTPNPEVSGGGTGDTFDTTTDTTTGDTGGFNFENTNETLGDEGDLPAGEVGADEEAVGTQPTAGGGTEPETPAYVWALIPLGLLALALVRSTIMEPIIGKRPDGVVAMIRQRNAARRGSGLISEATSPLAAVAGVFQHAGGRVRKTFGGLGESIRSTFKRGKKP